MLILKLLGWFLLICIACAMILLLGAIIYFSIRIFLETNPKTKCKYCSEGVKSFCRDHEKWKQECKGSNHECDDEE